MFDAHVWREAQAHSRAITLAWYTAALQRAKRLPSLKRLLNPPKTKRLTPQEKRQRAAEFAELTERMGGGSGG